MPLQWTWYLILFIDEEYYIVWMYQRLSIQLLSNSLLLPDIIDYEPSVGFKK